MWLRCGSVAQVVFTYLHENKEAGKSKAEGRKSMMELEVMGDRGKSSRVRQIQIVELQDDVNR
jgi:hypothetical protein